MSMNILNDISAVYREQVAESAVPGKPAEKLGAVTAIPKSEQEAARERLLAKAKAKRESMKEERDDEPGEGKRQKYGDMRGLDRSGPPTSFGGKWQSKERKAAGAAALAKLNKEETEIEEASYSAKAARAGKDIGKPGKAFAKIAKSASERYGSEERGKKVAGAVLAKLRKEEIEIDEAEEKDPFGRPGGKYGGVPKKGGGYDRGYQAMQKKLKELEKTRTEALDPVGQEDDDIDNDGDTDKSDKYLHNRRKAVGKAIAKKKGMKEGFSNWRQDLSEVMDDAEATKEIKEKKVNNKIKINPEMKEAVEQLGGELIEMVEVDEAVYGGTPAKKEEPKDTRYTVTAADKKGNTTAYQKYKAGDKRYKAAPHLGEGTLQEKALSKQQQKFMGMVYAVKKGDMAAPSPEVAKAAAGMTKQQAKDFAKTKHKGLPNVKEEMDEPIDSAQDKASEMQKKKIQVQKVRELTTRLQSARKGVY